MRSRREQLLERGRAARAAARSVRSRRRRPEQVEGHERRRASALPASPRATPPGWSRICSSVEVEPAARSRSRSRRRPRSRPGSCSSSAVVQLGEVAVERLGDRGSGCRGRRAPRNTIARKPSHLGSKRSAVACGSSSASLASMGSIGGGDRERLAPESVFAI